MSYYDEDFYYEPSGFDILVDEFKESLTKAIKDDYVSEMERLKKENEELQNVKDKLEEIKADYDCKKSELEYEYQNLKSNVRRERLSQLMKDFEVELYTVASRGKSFPKCDKCDEKRRIYYKTPSGKETYETCECNTQIKVYEPISTILSSFSLRDGIGSAWYQVKIDNHDDYLSYYEDSISGKELIVDEKQFEDIGYAYKTLFKNEEMAQKYCDYKNKV
jgi:hypothetical protein